MTLDDFVNTAPRIEFEHKPAIFDGDSDAWWLTVNGVRVKQEKSFPIAIFYYHDTKDYWTSLDGFGTKRFKTLEEVKALIIEHIGGTITKGGERAAGSFHDNNFNNKTGVMI